MLQIALTDQSASEAEGFCFSMGPRVTLGQVTGGTLSIAWSQDISPGSHLWTSALGAKVGNHDYCSASRGCLRAVPNCANQLIPMVPQPGSLPGRFCQKSNQASQFDHWQGSNRIQKEGKSHFLDKSLFPKVGFDIFSPKPEAAPGRNEPTRLRMREPKGRF